MKNKVIIFIHGLAEKPKEQDLHNLWKQVVLANLEQIDIKVDENIFKFAYWADFIPTHIPTSRSYHQDIKKSVSNLIRLRKKVGSDFHIGAGDAVKYFFADRGAQVLDIFTNALTIKDDLIVRYLDEIKLYTKDQYIADTLRNSLEKKLSAAWDSGKEVMIISHSMGTIIAFDVLWRFSHSQLPKYKKYRKNYVSNLTTMGSPLGDNAVKDFLLNRKSNKSEATFYPTNIRAWHNYSAVGDVVCFDQSLADDYMDRMCKLQVLKDFREYTNLYNPFVYGSGKANAHKSFGYLAQPKLAKWIGKFLLE